MPIGTADATLDAHEENLWPTPVPRWQFAGVGDYEQDVSDEAAFQESARSWTSGSVWRIGKNQVPVSECKRVLKRVSLWGFTPSSRPRTDKWECESLVETILWVHCLITCPRQCALPICLRFHFLTLLKLLWRGSVLFNRTAESGGFAIEPGLLERVDSVPEQPF
jgi:hypothetical protein